MESSDALSWQSLLGNLQTKATFDPVIVPFNATRSVALVRLVLDTCVSCNSLMYTPDNNGYSQNPVDSTLRQQFYRANIKIASRDWGDLGVRLCVDCVKAGKARVMCYLCKEYITTDQVQEQSGLDDIDYLCKNCFSTVTAERWQKALDEIYANHRYDNG